MPDDVSINQGVHDLLIDNRRGKAGWFSGVHSQAIGGRVENGVRIITYTFEAKTLAHNIEGIAKPVSMNAEQREAAIHIFKEIEKVCNIKFRPVSHIDQVNKADIRLFQARIFKPDFINGVGGGLAITDGGIKDIILNDNLENCFYKFGKKGYGTLTHEIMHALGFSHPNGDGNNPAYSKNGTVLSYNRGTMSVGGIAPLDMAALQYLYGKPADQTTNRVVTQGDLLTSSHGQRISNVL